MQITEVQRFNISFYARMPLVTMNECDCEDKNVMSPYSYYLCTSISVTSPMLGYISASNLLSAVSHFRRQAAPISAATFNGRNRPIPFSLLRVASFEVGNK